MVVAGIAVGACALLFAAGLIAPQLSKKPQYRLDKLLSKGAGRASKAPGRLGKWMARPFAKSQKAANKSAGAGRKTRFKLPF
jgi:hypothetical protein